MTTGAAREQKTAFSYSLKMKKFSDFLRKIRQKKYPCQILAYPYVDGGDGITIQK